MSADRPARIAPLSPRQWPPEMREALAPLTPPVPRDPNAPKGLNVLGMLAWNPELARAYNQLTAHLMYRSGLTDRQRELAVLRVAALRHGEYVWAQHAVGGRDAGMTDEEIARVAAGPAAPGWDPLEAAILAAVDELVADARIGDDTWGTLRASFDERTLLDLIFCVGTYETLVMAVRSCAIDLDDDLRATVTTPLT